MSLLEELGKFGIAAAGVIGMAAFAEGIREEVKATEKLGLLPSKVREAEKEFVEAWDKLWKTRKAEAQLKEMLKEAEELVRREKLLAEQGKEFRQRYGKLLEPGS
jgi:Zn-dependent M32 family carboxypeptidase